MDVIQLDDQMTVVGEMVFGKELLSIAVTVYLTWYSVILMEIVRTRQSSCVNAKRHTARHVASTRYAVPAKVGTLFPCPR